MFIRGELGWDEAGRVGWGMKECGGVGRLRTEWVGTGQGSVIDKKTDHNHDVGVITSVAMDAGRG